MTLAQRMLTAADTLAEVSALYAYREHDKLYPDQVTWSAASLRDEAVHIFNDTPLWDVNCSGYVYTGDNE